MGLQLVMGCVRVIVVAFGSVTPILAGALLVPVVDGVSTYQHALVQHAAYQDAGQLAAEENDVAGLLGTQQAGPDVSDLRSDFISGWV